MKKRKAARRKQRTAPRKAQPISVRRRLGDERERFTLNFKAVSELPPKSDRYLEYEQAFGRFCWALDREGERFAPGNWVEWLRRTPPADAGQHCTARRPCRYYSCEHHLAVERVKRDGYSLRLLQPFTKLRDLRYTCVFDVIRDNPDGASMSLIGSLLSLKKQSVHYHWRIAQQRWKERTRELDERKKAKRMNPTEMNTKQMPAKLYQSHPAADIFPALEPEALRELAEDIKANGLHERVVLLDGKILDGRNRYAACLLAGVEPQMMQWVPRPGETPISYVLSMNLHRRHLSESQRAMVAAKVSELYAADAKLRQEATRISSGKPVVAGLPPPDAGKSRDKAAEVVNVSPRSVQAAKAVLESGAPELIKAVAENKASVSAAAVVATSMSPERQAAVAAEGKQAVAQAAKKIQQRRERESLRKEKLEKPAQVTHRLLDGVKAAMQKAVRQWPESEPMAALIKMLREMAEELEGK